MTRSRSTNLSLCLTAGGTLQPSLPIVAVVYEYSGQQENNNAAILLLLECTLYYMRVCVLCCVCSCMAILCPLLYMKKGQKLSGGKQEDEVDSH